MPLSQSAPAPLPAMPSRPPRRLSTARLLRVALSNTLAAMDEELFDELIVERRFVWGRFFAISDPAGVRRVMQDNVDNYPRIEAIHRVFRFSSGSGMLCAEGEVWRRHRRLLNPTLDHRTIVADLPVLVELTQALADYLCELPPPREINIGEVFSHLITAFTGRLFAANEREIDPVVHRLGQYPGKYSLFDFVPLPRWLGRVESGRTEVAGFHALLDRLIAERRSPGYDGREDLLRRIANARDRDTGERLTHEELRDEALTLGATSATPLRVFPWLWYLLATHPAVEARLHAELGEVLGGRAPCAEDLPRLVYLRRVVDETLRLYPPAPTMLRTAAADDVVCGRRIPRKSIVGIMPWVVHRHRKLWHNPDQFDPERFTPENTAARSRYAYLPFAVGPHVCIGASLALMEIMVAVAIMAQRFRFRLVPGHKVEPIAWTNLHPRGGIRATVEPRDESAPQSR
jgi:cytochrome P450